MTTLSTLEVAASQDPNCLSAARQADLRTRATLYFKGLGALSPAELGLVERLQPPVEHILGNTATALQFQV